MPVFFRILKQTKYLCSMYVFFDVIRDDMKIEAS